MKNRTILIFLFFCSFQSVLAQDVDSSMVIVEDGYIGKLFGKVTGEISLNNDFEKFSVITPQNSLKISPNTALNIRFKASYRFVTAAFSIAPSFLPGNNDDHLKGKSKSFKLGSIIILKHLYVEGHYFNLQGYYLENTEDFIPKMPGDPFIQYPDLYYQGYVVNIGWSSNARFSFKSIVSQTERQLKSAGSFFSNFENRYYIIDNRSPGQVTQKSRNLEFNLGPGYMYNFVFKKKFYIALGGIASVGYLNIHLETRFKTGSYYSQQNNFALKYEGIGALGHNGNKFYSGIYARLIGKNYNQENTNVHNVETRVNLHFFIGFRFNAPKFLERQFDSVESKIPYYK